jgi:hypothetical protein
LLATKWWRSRVALLGLIATLLIGGGATAAVSVTFSHKSHHAARGPTAKLAAKRTPAPVAATPSPATPATTALPAISTAPSASPPQAGAQQAVQQHLEDIDSGKYQQAFQMMFASYQGGNPSWPSNRAAANPGINIISVGTATPSGQGDDVTVDFYARDRNLTPGSDTLCREFTGTVNVIKQGGTWKYNPSGNHLTAAVTPQSNKNCPT